jgi:GT2 family glycosyltransferase
MRSFTTAIPNELVISHEFEDGLMQYSLCCVLVNWNLAEDTIECIDSLLSAGLPCERIIIVDNGSTDGSVPKISRKFGSDLIWINNENNRGFVFACNQGIQIALELGCDWIFILNNDAIVAPEFFSIFEKAVQEYPSYELLGPSIFDAQEPQRILFMGDKRFPLSLATYSVSKAKAKKDGQPDIIPVDFLNGCAMLVEKEVFRKIGKFDESLIMYGEEVDFCWRAGQAGFQLACIRQAKVWHKSSKSANKVKKRARFLKIRNQIIFYRKYAHGIQRPVMFVFTIIKIVSIGFKDIFSQQTNLLSSLISGWYQGWFVR